jgi:hypothetical protein
MTIYELDIAWAATTDERRLLRWELLSSDAVHGVFVTAREETLAVLFDGSRAEFAAWSSALTRDIAPDLTSAITQLEGEAR